MPEFHKNQIAWEAPEAQKVKLATPDTKYLADAINTLAQATKNIEDAEAKYLDDSLKADLDEQLNLANRDIDDARSVTADFDSLGEKALSRIQATLSQYDPATQRRFLRDNPHYIDNTQLAISEKILKRERDIFENHVDNNLPLWTSQAVMKGTKEARQEVIHKIQKSLGNISYETTVNDMIFKANQMMDKYNIARLISIGTPEALEEAKVFLRNPEQSITIDPYSRVVFDNEIKNQEKQNAKSKAIGEDPMSKGILETYAALQMSGRSADAEYIYDQVAHTTNGIIKTSPAGWALDADGKAIPAYIELNGFTPTQRGDLAKKMKQYDFMNPNALMEKLDFINTTSDLLVAYQTGFDNKTSEQSEAIAGLKKVMNSRLFDELADDTQKEVRRIVNQNAHARAELLIYDSMPYRDNGYNTPTARRIHPREDLIGYITATKQRTPTFVEDALYDKYGVARKIADYILGAKSLGDSAIETIKPLRETFYSDVEDNTIGEYLLLNWGILATMQNAGLLTGTRFDTNPDVIADTFDGIIGGLRATKTLNNRTDDKNATIAEETLKGLVGGRLTEEEIAIIDTVTKAATSSQVQRDFNSLGNFLNKNIRRTNTTIHIPSSSDPNPTLKTLKVTNAMSSQAKKRSTAIAKTKD